jgi:sulfofructose kinase
LVDLLKLTDYAIFSGPALREFVSAPKDSERLEVVLSYGPKHAGVTLGSEGYTWREASGSGHVPAFAVAVTDTTGAGDAFHGAFTLMLAEGRTAPDSARLVRPARAEHCGVADCTAGLALGGVHLPDLSTAICVPRPAIRRL